jgi:hypothetical protein
MACTACHVCLVSDRYLLLVGAAKIPLKEQALVVGT